MPITHDTLLLSRSITTNTITRMASHSPRFVIVISGIMLVLANPIAVLAQPAVSSVSANEMYRSVVRIEVSTQNADYTTPWNSGRFSGSIGTGFLIGKNQFLTNAHVISNAQRVLLTIYGSATKYPAKVKHVAHDCDLALLEVEDFSDFATLPVFKIGDAVPQLESQVRVIGYPVGGDRLSVTRGVVSRIDFQAYSHSRSDSHLIVQIDAAINPGNSGGPVLQNDAVIGVAFQGLRQADNTGYIIPTPVISRFLKDIEDGSYDCYTELGTSIFPLINPAMRTALQLPRRDLGVLVTNVTPGSSCDPQIKPGDVLIGIDSHPIDASGAVLIDGEKVNMNEIVERKFVGNSVDIQLIRAGKTLTQTIVLKTLPPAQMYSIQYEKKPRYLIHGGLVMQPLDTNLYAASQFTDVTLRRFYADYVSKGLFQKMEDVVVLTRVIPDTFTSSLPECDGLVVKSINGISISSLQQAHDILQQVPKDGSAVIELHGLNRPLVLPAAGVEAANQRIQAQYNIEQLERLQP